MSPIAINPAVCVVPRTKRKSDDTIESNEVEKGTKLVLLNNITSCFHFRFSGQLISISNRHVGSTVTDKSRIIHQKNAKFVRVRSTVASLYSQTHGRTNASIIALITREDENRRKHCFFIALSRYPTFGVLSGFQIKLNIPIES